MANRPIISMPKIEPIQFPVKGYGFLKRLWRWFTYTRKWRIIKDWYFDLPRGARITVMVPSGFEFDGASVPKLLRGLLSPVGILFIPGILHDYSFRYNKLIGVNADGSYFDYMPRAGEAFWNDLFREVADYVNGLKYINKIAWFMLHLFGFAAWNKHRKKVPKLNLVD